MSKKEFSFQPRNSIPSIEERKVVEKQQVIKKVVVEENDSLKITTVNGSKCNIFLKNYEIIQQRILSNCLIEGDLIQMKIQSGKILECEVDISSEKYKIENVVRLKEKLVFIFQNEKKEEKVELCSSLISGKRVICEDANGPISWFDLYFSKYLEALDREIQLYYVGERVVYIKFKGILEKMIS